MKGMAEITRKIMVMRRLKGLLEVIPILQVGLFFVLFLRTITHRPAIVHSAVGNRGVFLRCGRVLIAPEQPGRIKAA